MPDWYPGCKVRLVVRLEDNSRGIYPPKPSTGDTAAGPESFGSGSPDGLPADDFIEVDVVPTTARVELNSYRIADTAKITIPLARLPVDPRLIRAVSVQVFGGVFAPEDFADAMQVGSDALVLEDLPDDRTAVPDSFGGMTNELFRGFADEIAIDVGEMTLDLDCRDLTGELLDAEIPPNTLAELPGFLRLDEAIQLLLTGDSLAGQDVDQRITQEQTKEIGRKRRKLRAELDAQIEAELDAQIAGDAAAAAAALAKALELQAKLEALRGSVDALPPVSQRFGMPGFRGAKVVNEVIDITDPTGTRIQELPTIEVIHPKAWLDSRGVTRKGRKKATGTKAKVSYWDFIHDLVTSAGYIVFMRSGQRSGVSMQLAAVEIVISNPRTYYGSSETAGDSQPIPIDTRRFIWGQNLEGMTLSRSLKGTAVPSVGVRAYDSATGERYGVIYPPVQKNNRPTPTGDGDRIEIKQFNLDQISGPSPEAILAYLEAAARSIYEQLSRGDLEVGVKTTALAGLERNLVGLVADVFAMRPKDPFAVELPAEDPITGIVSAGLILDETDLGKRIEQGRLAGLDPESARKLAIAASTQYLQTEFRTQKIMLDFDDGTGWSIDIAGINFLDVRDAINAMDQVS